MLSDRPVRRPCGVHDVVTVHRAHASRSDKVYLITLEFILPDGQHSPQKNHRRGVQRTSAYLEMASEYCGHEFTVRQMGNHPNIPCLKCARVTGQHGSTPPLDISSGTGKDTDE